MAPLSNSTQLSWMVSAVRQFQLHLSSIATCLLPGFVVGSFVCLSCTFAGRINAAEPQSAPKVALQGDGRFLGYTRLREGTKIPATLGTVVALGPRRWAFVPAAAPVLDPVLDPVQSVTESESVKITVTQQGGTVTRRVDSVTLSTKVPAPRNGGDRSRGVAAASALQDTGSSGESENNSEHIVLISENLMLQRIVQAIREDELDSLWQVTGRVTEYFGENRLTILTAQRGQAKQLPPAAGR
ncbi:MAG: hypothetical protein ACR2N1_17945 [Rubripirellula sp.]